METYYVAHHYTSYLRVQLLSNLWYREAFCDKLVRWPALLRFRMYFCNDKLLNKECDRENKNVVLLKYMYMAKPTILWYILKR